MPEPLDPRRRAALGLKGRGSRPPDPRHIVTPDAFEVDAALLGIPLAPHGRRLVAIGVDVVLVAILTQAGGLLLGILAAGFFLRLALGGKRGGATRASGSLADGPGAPVRKGGEGVPGAGLFRGALGCMGALILFVTVMAAWGILSGGPRGAPPSWEDTLPRAPVESTDTPEVQPRPGDPSGADTLPGEGGIGTEALAPTGPADLSALLEDALRGAATIQEDPTPRPAAQSASPDQGRMAGIRAFLRTLAEDLGLGFGWGALYFSAFLAWGRGQTPGKRLLGLRVVRLDSKPISLWGAFERYGGYAAGFATGLLGFAQVFWDANRQAIHDKITGTVVIRDGAAPLPEPTRRLRNRDDASPEPRDPT